MEIHAASSIAKVSRRRVLDKERFVHRVTSCLVCFFFIFFFFEIYLSRPLSQIFACRTAETGVLLETALRRRARIGLDRGRR